jgi:GGDEF domain-containing protein
VRVGGEKFALLLPHCHASEAQQCAEALRVEIEALYTTRIPEENSVCASEIQKGLAMIMITRCILKYF